MNSSVEEERGLGERRKKREKIKKSSVENL